MRRLLTLTTVAAAIGLPPPALAEPSGDDAGFLEALKNAGITYQSPDSAVANAKAVCGMLDDGKGAPEIVAQLQQANAGFAQRDAAKFVALASVAYCPKYMQGGGDSK
ncbi:hypothetical protein BST20_16460 [Mycobacterium branderi]|uniref:DUF732 domain-containing protein n=2 Tax=Mycobacterium branderi TaxID=43348 RepID=A0A7I7W9G6_9MYCO|nr:hypothetical protein BST20_16460 [Mycobacterium branderi]BBZ14289.1 hypothetical protein MBRA_44840 [Mycobacterium branderi]